MKKNAIFEDFFFLSDEKKRENEEGIRYRMKESFFKAFSLLYKENLSEENFGLPQKQKSSTVCTTSSDEFKVKLKFRLSLSFLVLEATQCDPSLSKSAAGGGVFTLR